MLDLRPLVQFVKCAYSKPKNPKIFCLICWRLGQIKGISSGKCLKYACKDVRPHVMTKAFIAVCVRPQLKVEVNVGSHHGDAWHAAATQNKPSSWCIGFYTAETFLDDDDNVDWHRLNTRVYIVQGDLMQASALYFMVNINRVKRRYSSSLILNTELWTLLMLALTGAISCNVGGVGTRKTFTLTHRLSRSQTFKDGHTGPRMEPPNKADKCETGVSLPDLFEVVVSSQMLVRGSLFVAKSCARMDQGHSSHTQTLHMSVDGMGWRVGGGQGGSSSVEN